MRRLPTLLVSLFAIAAIGCAAEVAVDPGGTPPTDDGPGDAIPADAVRLATETLYRDPGSGIEAGRRAVIRTGSAWEAFWSEAHEGRTGAGPAPEVDFDRSMVVVATMGERSTGGHSIDIAGVYATEGGIVTEVVETEPGEGCVVTQALTAPAVAVSVERRSGEATWLVRQERSTC